MLRKSVHAAELQVGAVCDVEVRTGNKRSRHEARVLGIGKLLNTHALMSIHVVCAHSVTTRFLSR